MRTDSGPPPPTDAGWPGHLGKGHDMKYCRVLCVLVLAACLSGCADSEQAEAKAPETKAAPHQASLFPVRSTWDSRGAYVERDVSEMPRIITGVLEEMGIVIEQKNEQPERCEYVAKSPGGLDVQVRATAILKGSCHLETNVHGQASVAKMLAQKVTGALVEASR